MGVSANSEIVKRYTGLAESIPHSAFLDGDYYVDADWTSEIAKKYFMSEPVVFWNFAENGYKIGEALWEYMKSNYRKLETTEDFFNLQEKLCGISSFLQLTHPLSKAIENHVTEILRSKGISEDDLNEALIEVSAPEKLNGPSQEIKDLEVIKNERETNKDFDLEKAIKEHTEKWSYLGYRDCFSQGYTEEFFIKRLDSVGHNSPKVTNKYSFNFTADEFKWISLMKEFIYFRNYRTEVLYGCFFLAEKFWFKFSVANNLGEFDLSYYLVNEIYDLLKTRKMVPNEELDARKERFGIVMDLGETKIIVGQELNEKIKDVSQAIDITSQIKGTVACKGKITGRAKIVIGANNQDKILSGDILVTSMTTPDLLPCMGRAAAFITDEGGITCHAAIVAREMKKPCIIGTKNATKIIKDGDLVEVDANNGIVRIIK
jgi:phosphohistidine swiveling domain-containing protein